MHVLIDANVPLDMWLEPVMSRHSVDASTLVFDAVAKGRITAYITPTIFSNVFFFLRTWPSQSHSAGHGLVAPHENVGAGFGSVPERIGKRMVGYGGCGAILRRKATIQGHAYLHLQHQALQGSERDQGGKPCCIVEELVKASTPWGKAAKLRSIVRPNSPASVLFNKVEGTAIAAKPVNGQLRPGNLKARPSRPNLTTDN